MSAPRPRKPRDIETFRERRADERDHRAYRKWVAGTGDQLAERAAINSCDFVRISIPGLKAAEAFSVARSSRALCAVCHQENCHHGDLEYAGIVPEPRA